MPIPAEIPEEIVLLGEESANLSVEDFANFLRDLVFLHDRIWIIASGMSKEYDIAASFFYTRYGRPVPEDQRLQLLFARKGSPFELGMIIRSAPIVAGTAWVFVQALNKLVLLPGKYRKQQLENQALRKAIEDDTRPTERPRDDDLWDLLKALELPEREIERDFHLVKRDIERISENKVIITEIGVMRTVRRKLN